MEHSLIRLIVALIVVVIIVFAIYMGIKVYKKNESDTKINTNTSVNITTSDTSITCTFTNDKLNKTWSVVISYVPSSDSSSEWSGTLGYYDSNGSETKKCYTAIANETSYKQMYNAFKRSISNSTDASSVMSSISSLMKGAFPDCITNGNGSQISVNTTNTSVVCEFTNSKLNITWTVEIKYVPSNDITNWSGTLNITSTDGSTTKCNTSLSEQSYKALYNTFKGNVIRNSNDYDAVLKSIKSMIDTAFSDCSASVDDIEVDDDSGSTDSGSSGSDETKSDIATHLYYIDDGNDSYYVSGSFTDANNITWTLNIYPYDYSTDSTYAHEIVISNTKNESKTYIFNGESSDDYNNYNNYYKLLSIVAGMPKLDTGSVEGMINYAYSQVLSQYFDTNNNITSSSEESGANTVAVDLYHVSTSSGGYVVGAFTDASNVVWMIRIYPYSYDGTYDHSIIVSNSNSDGYFQAWTLKSDAGVSQGNYEDAYTVLSTVAKLSTNSTDTIGSMVQNIYTNVLSTWGFSEVSETSESTDGV